MTPQQTRRYIDEAAACDAKWVSFTGGEPFLVYDVLMEATRHAHGKGLLTEAVTNCNWATSPGVAHGRLKHLKEAGLDVVNLSVDDFHQRNIPLQRVKNCYSAAKSHGLKPVLMIAVRRGSEITADTIGRLLEDPGIQVFGGERKSAPTALAMETTYVPVGRGSKLPEDELLTCNEIPRSPCREALTDIGVKPNGDVMPCCGPLGALEEAAIGNLEEEPLEKVLERAWSDERLRGIHMEGPAPIEGAYVNRCHRCVEWFRGV